IRHLVNFPIEPKVSQHPLQALEAVKDVTQPDIVDISSETTVSVMDTYRESLNQCMNRGNHHLSEVQVARFDGVDPRSLTEHQCQILHGVRSDERVGHGRGRPLSIQRLPNVSFR
ncbi:hypothetical protein NPIL_258781, partial [Nephila pilipes]